MKNCSPSQRDGNTAANNYYETKESGKEATNVSAFILPGNDKTPPQQNGQTNPGNNIKPVNDTILWNHLYDMFPKSPLRGLNNTTAILICLHQSPKQSIKDLQKLTGLSEDGMVKRIMAMKKFGLLTRVRGTGLVLTAKAAALLEASRK